MGWVFTIAHLQIFSIFHFTLYLFLSYPGPGPCGNRFSAKIFTVGLPPCGLQRGFYRDPTAILPFPPTILPPLCYFIFLCCHFTTLPLSLSTIPFLLFFFPNQKYLFICILLVRWNKKRNFFQWNGTKKKKKKVILCSLSIVRVHPPPLSLPGWPSPVLPHARLRFHHL
jgi:hypothetical protein